MSRFLFTNIIVLTLILLLFAGGDLLANKRRMLGGDIVMTGASSYLTIDSGSVTVQDKASWSYATGVGWFFDYMINPYISFRSNWMFYPGFINSNYAKAKDEIGVIKLHELGFSLLRHFKAGGVDPWFGAGPYLQFATINDVDSYVVHILLSLGLDYEVEEDVFFCPELLFGIGAKIINSDEESVVVDLPTGSDFSTSGIIILFKLGVAKSF